MLNHIAGENERPSLPYNLEGEGDQKAGLPVSDARKYGYSDLVKLPALRIITFPLLAVWVFREYVYYSAYLLVPEMGDDVNKNLILLSVSEIVAVIMSYPINLKIKRVNAFFMFTALILGCCIIASFTTVSADCKMVGTPCFSKYVYRIAEMVLPDRLS